MALALKDSLTIGRMAAVLYSLLPGSGDKRWKGHVSFETVAAQLGLSDFWSGREQGVGNCDVAGAHL